jgi:hypothetical protein
MSYTLSITADLKDEDARLEAAWGSKMEAELEALIAGKPLATPLCCHCGGDTIDGFVSQGEKRWCRPCDTRLTKEREEADIRARYVKEPPGDLATSGGPYEHKPPYGNEAMLLDGWRTVHRAVDGSLVIRTWTYDRSGWWFGREATIILPQPLLERVDALPSLRLTSRSSRSAASVAIRRVDRGARLPPRRLREGRPVEALCPRGKDRRRRSPPVNVVFKYPQGRDIMSLISNGDEFSIDLPTGARVLTVQSQRDSEAFIWAQVDPDAPMKPRRFRLAGTGHPIADPDHWAYIGSFQLRAGRVGLPSLRGSGTRAVKKVCAYLREQGTPMGPAWEDVLVKARAKKVDIVVVHAPWVLGDTQAQRDQSRRELTEAGVELHVVHPEETD